VRYSEQLPPDFVPNLLEVRLALAPAYTRAAVERSPVEVVEVLADHIDLEDSPRVLAAYDWILHHALTVASGNPVYTLILNGFSGFYEEMAFRYFSLPEARALSRAFYADLLAAAQVQEAVDAELVARRVMRQSIELWQEASGGVQ
jgi:GntR family negative regulator for fad regulon and positive regulator of fabA